VGREGDQDQTTKREICKNTRKASAKRGYISVQWKGTLGGKKSHNGKDKEGESGSKPGTGVSGSPGENYPSIPPPMQFHLQEAVSERRVS